MRALEMALRLCALARGIVLGTPTGCRERASNLVTLERCLPLRILSALSITQRSLSPDSD